MNSVRTFIGLLWAALGAFAFATPNTACLMERPQPTRDEIAARKARVAETESKAMKLIRELQSEAKSSSGPRAKAIRADLKHAEAVLGRLRELQAREYCGTASPDASAYITEVLLRIEECGTRNFPVENGRRLYGNAEAEFVIDLSGALYSERILKSSKTPQLDAHISKIIGASAPFGAVPEAISMGKYQYLIFREKFSFVRREDDKVSEPRTKCRM